MPEPRLFPYPVPLFAQPGDLCCTYYLLKGNSNDLHKIVLNGLTNFWAMGRHSPLSFWTMGIASTICTQISTNSPPRDSTVSVVKLKYQLLGWMSDDVRQTVAKISLELVTNLLLDLYSHSLPRSEPRP
jgi:hypothetical protein